MKDVYVEWMVSKKRSLTDKFLRGASIVVLVTSLLLFLLTGHIILFIVAVAAGVGAYFAFSYTDVEYEYVYISGEFSIDRILAKSMRKRIERFNTGRIEVVAPLKSRWLDGYAHKKYRECDYSTGVVTPSSHVFVMYYNEGKKVLFEPSREFMEAMKATLPHKVHLDM